MKAHGRPVNATGVPTAIVRPNAVLHDFVKLNRRITMVESADTGLTH